MKHPGTTKGGLKSHNIEEKSNTGTRRKQKNTTVSEVNPMKIRKDIRKRRVGTDDMEKGRKRNQHPLRMKQQHKHPHRLSTISKRKL